MIKLTFLIQYYRVLGVYKMKKVIWYTGVVIMMWAFSQLLVVIFSCTPVQKFWETELEGQCLPNLPFWYINAAGNIATDLAILGMPLPVLAKLKLRRQQKYILLGIFCLGFLYVQPFIMRREPRSYESSVLTLCQQHLRHLAHPPRLPQARSRFHMGQCSDIRLVRQRAVLRHHLRVSSDSSATNV